MNGREDHPRAPAATVISRLKRDESGFGLVELMVASLLATLVLGAVVMFSVVGQRSQRVTGEHTAALAQQRAGLEGMTRELRQARTFTLVSASVAEADTMVRPGGAAAQERRVRYDCSGGRCRRSEGPSGGPVTGAAIPKVIDVQNTNAVFSNPSPNYVEITLDVQVQGRSTPITLRDGVDMRNAPG